MAKLKTSTRSRPRLGWAPYQNLLAFYLSQGLALQEARKAARTEAARTFPGDQFTISWTKPPDEAVQRARSSEITPALRSLCRGDYVGGRTEARIRLDRLLLSYARSGFDGETALREIYLDYDSMEDVPPLSEAEIASYAQLYWDFLGLQEARDGLAYLKAALPDSEELTIFRAGRTLAQVRADTLVLRPLSRPDFGGEVAVQVNAVMQHLATQIRAEVMSLQGSGAKTLNDRAMLLARLSLTQDRLRRSQAVDTAEEEQLLGLDELLSEVQRGRDRRRALASDVPWDDPAALVTSASPGAKPSSDSAP